MLDSARNNPSRTDGIRRSIRAPDRRMLWRYGAMADEAVVLRAADVPARQVRTGQRFYVGFGVFVILLSFAGFAPSLIDQSRRFAPPTTLLLVHGATALAWLLLYVTQALLVARGRVDLHRRLGWAGPLIAALLVLFGYYTTIDGAFRVSDLSGDVTRLAHRARIAPIDRGGKHRGHLGSARRADQLQSPGRRRHFVQASRGASLPRGQSPLWQTLVSA